MAKQNPDKKSPQVFSDAYALCLQVFHYSKSIPKPYRPTLGRRLEESGLEVLLLLKKCLYLQAGQQKVAALTTLSQHLNELRTLLDLCRDLALLTPASYQQLSDLGLKIGAGVGALLKHHKNREPSNLMKATHNQTDRGPESGAAE